MTNSLKRPTRRQAMTALGAVGAAGAAALLTGCGGGGSNSGTSSTTATYPGGLGVMAPGSATVTVTHQVTLTTNYGVIVVGLDGTHAPVSVANFLAYVVAGTYNKSIFHRVVTGFVIQGGGYTDSTGTGISNGNYTLLPTNASIALESQNGLSNTQYTIGMARTSAFNSATNQFYFNLVNNATSLDYGAQLNSDGTVNPGYAVFGTVSATDTTSIATLKAISAVAVSATTASEGEVSWPNSDVVVTSAVQNF